MALVTECPDPASSQPGPTFREDIFICKRFKVNLAPPVVMLIILIQTLLYICTMVHDCTFPIRVCKVCQYYYAKTTCHGSTLMCSFICQFLLLQNNVVWLKEWFRVACTLRPTCMLNFISKSIENSVNILHLAT